jgi:SH3-like domain-containing protein
MVADARLTDAKMPGVTCRGLTSRSSLSALLLSFVLLLALMNVSWLRHAVAETTNPLRPVPLEHVTGFPKRGSVTTMANLRSSPSMQSEIVSIIKDGMPIEILMESGRWYRVKTEEGIEAWIGKSLVFVEPTARKMPSPVSGTPVQPEVQEVEGSPSPAPVMADASAEMTPPRPEAEDTADHQDAGFSQELSEEAPPPSLKGAELNWSIEGIFPYVQGLEAYVIPALVVVLLLAISFQLKAARQLRRAMQEMGLILDIIDEIYANGMLAQTGGSETMAKALPDGTSALRPEPPSPQFSALEHAMLQAMSDHREVEERELAEALAAKGFAGVLIKAVIGEIIRKTKTIGQQHIEVRYVQGRYRYQLRREDVSVFRKS